jgi:hypothetical protein
VAIMNCPRCGVETKGTGKTPLCQPCAGHFAALRVDMQPTGATTRKRRITRRKAPITLAPHA